MAQAHQKEEPLFFDVNVKAVARQLPNDLIRSTKSLEALNEKFERNWKMAQQCADAFENQAMRAAVEMEKEKAKDKDEKDAQDKSVAAASWSSSDSLCLSNLERMRQCESEMAMFEDEKLALLDSTIDGLQGFVHKISADLERFEAVLQPNMIKLAFPAKSVR